MHLRLRHGLSVCFPSDRAIFLDLPADRYFSLSPELEAAFGSWASGAELPDDDSAALVLHRLLQPAQVRELPSLASVTAPASSLLEMPPDRVRSPAVAAACFHLVTAAARLRTRGLARTIDNLGRRRARHGAAMSDIGRVARIAHAHEAAALLASSHDKCLPRSLALAGHLASAGLACELVLGVRMRPFHAHCWVQIADTVVNDCVETVRTFTPILLV